MNCIEYLEKVDVYYQKEETNGDFFFHGKSKEKILKILLTETI